jgi:anti-sigma regulatory factor (Ser/Thr protein kinase)
VQHSYPAGMATVAYAVLNTISGELLYASAGHPPALLVGSDGAQLVDVQPSPPIGVQPLPRYASTALELPAGAAILLYTDGLVERRGEPLSVGLQRLCRSALGSPSPEALCTRVLHDLIGPLSSEDDVAMVALRRHSTPQSLDLELPAARTSLALLRRRLSAWLSGNAVGDADRNAIVLAVGEAAANAVEHAYAPGHAVYRVEALVDGEDIVVTITDEGRWRTESRTTHRGRGLTIMRRAMDSVDIDNTDGTRVTLRRNVRRQG